jgi:hypothetical protein
VILTDSDGLYAGRCQKEAPCPVHYAVNLHAAGADTIASLRAALADAERRRMAQYDAYEKQVRLARAEREAEREGRREAERAGEEMYRVLRQRPATAEQQAALAKWDAVRALSPASTTGGEG